MRRVVLVYIKREKGRFGRGVGVWGKEDGWKGCKEGIVWRVGMGWCGYGGLGEVGEEVG